MVGKPKGTILDLYCGTGTIGLSFLKAGKGDHLVGIEIVPEAIEDAHINAQINGLADKSEFLAGKAELLLKDPQRLDRLSHIELVIIDPPRDGMHPDVVTFLCTLKKITDFKLCYISCNPVTLARDLRLLTTDQQFTVRKIQPVDMFPQTHHVEVVTLLS
jgi:23S rRNA (uracil1939-C5)-methyltransferase